MFWRSLEARRYASASVIDDQSQNSSSSRSEKVGVGACGFTSLIVLPALMAQCIPKPQRPAFAQSPSRARVREEEGAGANPGLERANRAVIRPSIPARCQRQ